MMRQFLENSMLFGTNAPFIEDLYEKYLSSPDSIPLEWRSYFDSLQQTLTITARDVPHTPIIGSFVRLAQTPPSEKRVGSLPVAPSLVSAEAKERKQIAVLQLINMYRFLGVRLARLDPLKHQQISDTPELDPAFYELTEADMQTVFNTGSLVGQEHAPLKEILQILRQTYCGTIGAEYMFLTDLKQKRWIQNRLEGPRSQP